MPKHRELPHSQIFRHRSRRTRACRDPSSHSECCKRFSASASCALEYRARIRPGSSSPRAGIRSRVPRNTPEVLARRPPGVLDGAINSIQERSSLGRSRSVSTVSGDSHFLEEPTLAPIRALARRNIRHSPRAEALGATPTPEHCPEAHAAKFVVIRTHTSPYLAVDLLGLSRNGSSSQIINQTQDFLEQVPRHGNLGQLERDVTAMSHDLRSDLDQLMAQRNQRLVLDVLR